MERLTFNNLGQWSLSKGKVIDAANTFKEKTTRDVYNKGMRVKELNDRLKPNPEDAMSDKSKIVQYNPDKM